MSFDPRIVTPEIRRTLDNLMKSFFGVTQAEIMEDGQIKCEFLHTSLDGLGEEKRWCFINSSFTPEKNMDVLLEARKQQRWYEKNRSARQAEAILQEPEGMELTIDSEFDLSSEDGPTVKSSYR